MTFSIMKEILSIVWQSCWGFLRGIWPTLDATFDVNHKIMIALIVAILAAFGVPKIVRNIVEHF